MKSITVHNMDAVLAETLKKKAAEQGMSINAIIKSLLSQALDLPNGEMQQKKTSGYAQFLGAWTEEDAASFNALVDDFNRIDEDEWK